MRIIASPSGRLSPDFTAVHLYDGARDGQSKSRAMVLGGVERIKDPIELIVWNARSRINHRNPRLRFPVARRLDNYLVTATSDASHRIHRVCRQIEPHLVEMDSIGVYR